MGQMKSAVVGGLAIAGTAAAAVATVGAAAAGGVAASGGSAGGAKAILGGLKSGAQSGLRMGGNYIATQNPFSRSFADSMNRFGGTAPGAKGFGMEGGFIDGLGIKGGEANKGNVTPSQALSNIASVYSGNPPPYGGNADSGKPNVDDPKKSGTGADGDTGQKPKDEPQSASGTPNKEETGDKAPIVMATAERPDGDKQFFHTKESKEKEVRTEPKGGAQPVVQGAPYQPGAASFPNGELKTPSGIVLPNTDSGRQAVQQVQNMSAAPQGDTRSASNVSMQNSMSSNVQNVMNSQVTNQNSTSVANQNISNISNNLSGGGTGGGGAPSVAAETRNKIDDLSMNRSNGNY